MATPSPENNHSPDHHNSRSRHADSTRHNAKPASAPPTDVVELARTGVTLSDTARLSGTEIRTLLTATFALLAALIGLVLMLIGELDRRQDWREDGAPSLVAWLITHMGISGATARAYGQVAERICDLPHLAGGLTSGQVSFDKVRAVFPEAEPENDAEIAELAKELSVPDLVAWRRARATPPPDPDDSEENGRWVRCNDARRTIAAKLTALGYAQVKKALEARAKLIPFDGETRFDQRMADALLSFVGSDIASAGSGGPATVVAHVPLEVFLDPKSTLPGELEHLGLVHADVVRRLACGSEMIVALDDHLGHTLYEGRAHRFPTPTQRREVRRRDRHCRFPGCTHTRFATDHHIEEWAAGGKTDLDNLVLLCAHHHRLIHSNAWSMHGDANEELTFVGPRSQVMTSSPSLLWAQVTDPALVARRRAHAEREAAAAQAAQAAGQSERTVRRQPVRRRRRTSPPPRSAEVDDPGE
jgi:hypothetical protein